MKTSTQINELREELKSAFTANEEGRQIVIDNCKALYHIIESELNAKYGDGATDDAYNDLCNGNFAEPFMCELKKSKFEVYATIYINNVM